MKRKDMVIGVSNLGELADSTNYQENIDITGFSRENLITFLRSMVMIRLTEQCLARQREKGLIGGPVHLGVGQEAIAVGISSVLSKNDKVFGAHRSHSHILALGSSVYKLFAEVLGKDTGHSKGMGGSMHLWDQSVGFYGSVPIVAGTVPLAVGAGLAAKLRGEDSIAVSYLGDGAVEEGVVHESLNLASTLKIPVIFVVENNLFASHMHISIRQPSDSTARFAQANAISSELVDGNDVIALSKIAKEAVDHAKSGLGPFFIEAVTYRWYGHVDWREDIDVGVNRSQKNVASWKARDPISRLREAMISEGIWSTKEDDELTNTLASDIETAWKQAMNDPYPHPDALLERVYTSSREVR
jgi:pyruvate dehydrogenase E1 component alpha subunit